MRPLLIWIVWGVLSLTGCASPQPKPTEGAAAGEASRRAVLRCDGGQSITVTFAAGAATLEAAGGTARLTQQRTGAGIHYAGDGNDLRGKGPDLTWTDKSGKTHACRDEALAMGQSPEPAKSLAGSKWRLIHFQSMDDAIGTVVPPNVERYTIEFVSDGSLALQLDCNRATGRWEAKPASATEGSLTMTGGAMTRAMCQPGALDTQIARDLAFVTHYLFVDGQLSLTLKMDSGIYLWAPASPGGG
jgi:heat shock protein HslJ